MSLTRIFVHAKINPEGKIALDEFASRHVLHALRLKIGDNLFVFNNSPGEFEASICSIDKNIAVILVGKFIPRENESPLSIHLAQGISRGEKMDFTIQKAVELGVHSITPLFTEYCNVKLKPERLGKKLQHWQKVAISAAEQSGRCYVPEILPTENLSFWYKNFALPSDLNLILEPSAKNKISSIDNHPKNVTILVGPEGGFSHKEIDLAKTNGFVPISLGPRILRTETAALATITALQVRWGDL